MLCQLWVASALCAVVLSAPTFSTDAAVQPDEMSVLSEYFQLLSTKVQEGKKMATAPVCDLSKAVLPVVSSSPLPAPSAGLTVKHIAVGRGTQNYTCSSANVTAAPVAVGAVATLFNATCVASTYPDILALLPNLALQFNLTSADQETLQLANLGISGHHFFSNATTPFFNLDASIPIGTVPCMSGNTTSAPPGAPLGQDNRGFGAVPWLRLTTRDGETGNIQEVYRVNTAGGKAPPTCQGMPASFEVQYAAEYWFFQS